MVRRVRRAPQVYTGDEQTVTKSGANVFSVKARYVGESWLYASGIGDATVGVGTNYLRQTSVTATEADAVRFIAPCAGVIFDLRGVVKQAVGGGNTVQLVVRVNGVDTAIDTGAVAGTGALADATDTAHSVVVAEGDDVTVKVVTAGAACAVKAAQVRFSPTEVA